MSKRLDNLQTQRLSAGLSLDDLAKAAGISAIYLALGEGNNHPFSADEADRLALACGCSLTDLGAADV